MSKDVFIKAIHCQNKIRVTFNSKEDKGIIIRICAPMDYGHSRRAKNQGDKYHMWDYESDKKPHPVSLKPEQIQKIELLTEKFDPSEFISWETNWIIERDWGQYS